MRIGVLILPELPWSTAQSLWRRAEELGFDHAWTYDHLAWRSLRDAPWFGAMPTLAAAAVVTTRMRLGTLVASSNFRHPVSFAKEIITLDDCVRGSFHARYRCWWRRVGCDYARSTRMVTARASRAICGVRTSPRPASERPSNFVSRPVLFGGRSPNLSGLRTGTAGPFRHSRHMAARDAAGELGRASCRERG